MPSPALVSAQKDVSQLVTKWDDALAARIAADNLFLDETAERRAARIRELNEKHGACRPAATIEAENALRGKWRMPCERGWVDVAITLAPTMPPRVQYLRAQGVLPPGPEAVKAIEHDPAADELLGWNDGGIAWGGRLRCRAVEASGECGVSLGNLQDRRRGCRRWQPREHGETFL